MSSLKERIERELRARNIPYSFTFRCFNELNPELVDKLVQDGFDEELIRLAIGLARHHFPDPEHDSVIVMPLMDILLDRSPLVSPIRGNDKSTTSRNEEPCYHENIKRKEGDSYVCLDCGILMDNPLKRYLIINIHGDGPDSEMTSLYCDETQEELHADFATHLWNEIEQAPSGEGDSILLSVNLGEIVKIRDFLNERIETIEHKRELARKQEIKERRAEVRAVRQLRIEEREAMRKEALRRAREAYRERQMRRKKGGY